MKYFICDLDSINLGVPAGQTERIISVQTDVSEMENKSDGEKTTFISLPELFRLKDRAAPHGIVLKTTKPPKTALLTPRIDIELEIPEEKIYRLPQVLSKMFRHVRGAYFTDQNLILILDTEEFLSRTTQERSDSTEQ